VAAVDALGDHHALGAVAVGQVFSLAGAGLGEFDSASTGTTTAGSSCEPLAM